MKHFISLILILLGISVSAQRYKTTASYIRFYSDAPMEDIEAINEASSSIVDLSNNAIVVVIPIKSFSFKKELMEEHFNENYLESDDYPKATFKGKINGWDQSEGKSSVSAKGTLELHGVEQEIEIEGEIEFDGSTIKIETVFPIKLEDYKIKIPKAVFYNIAEIVEVTARLSYKPYEKN